MHLTCIQPLNASSSAISTRPANSSALLRADVRGRARRPPAAITQAAELPPWSSSSALPAVGGPAHAPAERAWRASRTDAASSSAAVPQTASGLTSSSVGRDLRAVCGAE
jgi:hypothetical protein